MPACLPLRKDDIISHCPTRRILTCATLEWFFFQRREGAEEDASLTGKNLILSLILIPKIL